MIKNIVVIVLYHQKILCNNNDCKFCFEKSFASYEKSKYWSNKNIENPRNLMKSSDKKYWFNCNICSHEYECSLSNIQKRNCLLPQKSKTI